MESRVVLNVRNNLTTIAQTAEAARGKSYQLFSLFISISIITEKYTKFKWYIVFIQVKAPVTRHSILVGKHNQFMYPIYLNGEYTLRVQRCLL